MAVGSIYFFAELYLAGKLTDIYVKDISCEDPIERSKQPICVYCVSSMPEGDSAAEHYLQCFGYSQKPTIQK